LLFAIELMMVEISARTLIPVALATGTATYIGRAFFGNTPSFIIPALELHSTSAISAYDAVAWLCFGLLLGIASIVYIHALYKFEDLFDRLTGNEYARHMLGMLLVGIMMYLLFRFTGHYYIQGVGYATIQDILRALLLHPAFLLMLFALKMLSTSLTLGSGASGGIFSPSLFMGAALGGAYALLLNPLLPDAGLSITGTAVIGMAGMIAGATGAVITAIMMIFEMTRDYGVIIPLMIVASVAYGVRRALMRDSIYTMKLSRRGHSVPESLQTNMYLMQTAAELLDRPVQRHSADDPTPLRRLIPDMRLISHALLIDNGQVVGCLTSDKLRQLDPDTSLAEAFVNHGIRHFITVRADDNLFDIFANLRDEEASIALVTKHGNGRADADVLGALTWEEVALASNLPELLRHRKLAHAPR